MLFVGAWKEMLVPFQVSQGFQALHLKMDK